jgi:hypothetical protein
MGPPPPPPLFRLPEIMRQPGTAPAATPASIRAGQFPQRALDMPEVVPPFALHRDNQLADFVSAPPGHPRRHERVPRWIATPLGNQPVWEYSWQPGRPTVVMTRAEVEEVNRRPPGLGWQDRAPHQNPTVGGASARAGQGANANVQAHPPNPFRPATRHGQPATNPFRPDSQFYDEWEAEYGSGQRAGAAAGQVQQQGGSANTGAGNAANSQATEDRNDGNIDHFVDFEGNQQD